MDPAATATAPNTEAPASSEGSGEVSSDLSSEIDASVEAATAVLLGEAPDDFPSGEALDEEEVEEAPKDENKGADDVAGDEEEDDDDDAVALPNELIERAVKAGLSLDEVNQYPNEALLSKVLERIEGSAGEAGSQAGAGEVAPGEGADASTSMDDLLSSIPDLDPDEYDEKVVSGFKSLKEIIKRQNETIEGMQGAKKQDFFTTQLEGVKDFTKGDPAKVAGVREKFDVLKAGYKAAGKSVTDETVFNEAAKLVLGSEMEAARQSKKGKAAGKRSAQRIQRPTGRKASAKPTVQDEVAAELDRKFFS